MYAEWSYGAYLLISLIVTIWVAQTLFKNGRVFLVDAFHGNEKLADSVNHLLVVGFYLINVGYVSLMLKDAVSPANLKTSIEMLSWKIGLVLLILGAMHFFNLMVFSKMRNHAIEDQKIQAVAASRNQSLQALRDVKSQTTN
jgi:hypothetical protein